MKPWEKYQKAQPEKAGPWVKYQTQAIQEPTPVQQQITTTSEAPESLPDEMNLMSYQGMPNRPSAQPLLEVAANIGSSAVGAPIAGYAGLANLPLGLKVAAETVETAQKGLIYQPQTEAGKEILDVATYPLQKLEEAAGYVGGKLEKAGYPNLGAAAHTLVQAGPVIYGLKNMGGKAVLEPRKLNKIIDVGIEKGIRPSVAGKRTFSQAENYRTNAREAVTTIIDKKESLVLTNEAGEVVKGQLPENLKQFSQAIEQTKRAVFNEYDALTQEAGKAGAKVDLTPIVAELDNVAKSPTIQDLNPRISDYASKLSEALNNRQNYTTIEAQDAIATLNNKLDAFYKNPSFENANMASVDAMIANRLRSSLDSVIENLTGEQYQPLKTKYGSLKAIERDVSRRAIVDARKNTMGLVDFSNMISGADVVYGIMTMNPAMVGRGAAIATIKNLIKKVNDPNRKIKMMFRNVENEIARRGTLFSREPFGVTALTAIGAGQSEASIPPEQLESERAFSDKGESPGSIQVKLPDDSEVSLTVKDYKMLLGPRTEAQKLNSILNKGKKKILSNKDIREYRILNKRKWEDEDDG